MYKLIRTSKKVTVKGTSLYYNNPCVYDDMYREAIKFLGKFNGHNFKFKKTLYDLLDSHMRTCGVCHPENHLGKGNQTSNTLVNKAIEDGFIKLDKAVS